MRIKQLNETLPLLLLGIVAWGLLVQLIGIWFVDDKLRYSTGTWIGTALAIFMAIHMALTIESAVDRGSGVGILRFKSIIRYLVVVIVFLIMVYFNLGNWIPAFIAVLGLKVSAYAYPFIRKLFNRDNDDKTDATSEDVGVLSDKEEVKM